MALFHRERGHGGENYGPHEIEHAVKVAEFPITRQDLIAHYGAKAVQIEPGHAVDLRAILERIPVERFETTDHVREAAERAWEDIRRIPPYTGYPGERAWSDQSPSPEAAQHVAEEALGMSGDQHRLRSGDER